MYGYYFARDAKASVLYSNFVNFPQKSTPTKIPAPVANKGATPRSEERRPTRVCTRNKGTTYIF